MADAGASVRKRDAGRRRLVGVMTSRGLALFSEIVVVSLAVAMLSLPAVTALPALAAGGAHLRRHLDGESDALVDLWRDFVRALRRGWAWGVLAAITCAAIAFTLVTPAVVDVPGGEAVRWVSGGLGVGISIVLLRATARWSPSARWSVLLRESAEHAVRDTAGSLMLVLALALSVVIVWMFAPLVVLVPGMLILAARAVDGRSR